MSNRDYPPPTRTIVEDREPVTRAQFEYSMGLLMGQVDQLKSKVDGSMVASVRQGMVDAAELVLADKERVKRFWRVGFEELSTHASNESSQWIGKRLLTGLIVAIVTAGVAWLIQTGRWK